VWRVKTEKLQLSMDEKSGAGHEHFAGIEDLAPKRKSAPVK
jgi:hypothetical protein